MPTLFAISEDLCYEIVTHLSDNYPSLYCCALVSHTFSAAAVKELYRRVIVNPPWEYLRGRISATKPDWFFQSQSPKYAYYVKELHVIGPLSHKSSFIVAFTESLASAIRAYVNLEVVKLLGPSIARFISSNVFAGVLAATNLRSLSLDGQIPDPPTAMSDIARLRAISLIRPSRAFLHILPGLLTNNIDTLLELHLKGDCGSVTPGVLRLFAPDLQGITSFSLGLTYSVTNDDLFSFLSNLPNLTHLDLHYYWQMRNPIALPTLPILVSLTVHHPYVQNRSSAQALCRWIKTIIFRASLEELHLRVVDDISYRGLPNVSLDHLIYHLASSHKSTLRVLRMDWSFFGLQALSALCLCQKLEELELVVDQHPIVRTMAMPARLGGLHKLRLLALKPSHEKYSKFRMDPEHIQIFAEVGPGSLRQIDSYTSRLKPEASVWKIDNSLGGSTEEPRQFKWCMPTRFPWQRPPAYRSKT